MGVRLRPDLIGTGLCKEALAALLEGLLASGARKIRLDVAANNPRAIACYQKCGMQIADEFWRDGAGPDDPDDPKWATLLPQMRQVGDRWLVRFYWMEITPEHVS